MDLLLISKCLTIDGKYPESCIDLNNLRTFTGIYSTNICGLFSAIKTNT